jgi:hypothetical protein
MKKERNKRTTRRRVYKREKRKQKEKQMKQLVYRKELFQQRTHKLYVGV